MSADDATPRVLALPTDPIEQRLYSLTAFAAQVALWQAFGRHLSIILHGDGTKPGLLDPDIRRRLKGLGGKPTVSRSFIPDPPPWPEVWPEPASREEAVRVAALRLHLERLREVYRELKLEPAKNVKFGDRAADLPGYLIPPDYEDKIEIAAARLAATDAGLVAASETFLPALPQSTRPLLPELSWPAAPPPLALADGKGVEVEVIDASGRQVRRVG